MLFGESPMTPQKPLKENNPNSSFTIVIKLTTRKNRRGLGLGGRIITRRVYEERRLRDTRLGESEEYVIPRAQ